jgi:hypothetical protein
MIKNVLKGVAVVLAVSEISVLWFVLTLAEPSGRLPGGRLSGEEVTGRVTDWSFTRDNRPLTLEVRPSNPYSVNTSFFVLEGNLYVSSILGGDSRWAQFLIEDPNLRIRSGNKIYKVRATKIEEPELINKIHQGRGQRPGRATRTPEQLEGRGQRPARPTRTPEQLARIWFFRFDSR